MVLAFLISTGILLQIKAPEYDKMFLSLFYLGFGVLKCWLESERKVIVSLLLLSLIWNISVILSQDVGTILLKSCCHGLCKILNTAETLRFPYDLRMFLSQNVD